MIPPVFPTGAYVPDDGCDARRRAEWCAEIADAPARLRAAVADFGPQEFATRYKNWTVRQIVAHLVDSHMNAIIRFKLALTEEVPTVKPYDENLWVNLPDAAAADPDVLLTLFAALHTRWSQLLCGMTDADFARRYFHPANATTVSLGEALSQYAWHGRHHIGQIEWLRRQQRRGQNHT